MSVLLKTKTKFSRKLFSKVTGDSKTIPILRNLLGTEMGSSFPSRILMDDGANASS